MIDLQTLFVMNLASVAVTKHTQILKNAETNYQQLHGLDQMHNDQLLTMVYTNETLFFYLYIMWYKISISQIPSIIHLETI